MSKIVNLNKVRKAKAHAAAKQLASENRVRYGRTKAEKQRDETAEAEAQRRMDLLKREPAPEE